MKEIFVDLLSETRDKGHLSTSQRQAIIQVIHAKLETHFFITFKNNIKTSFRETKKCSIRLCLLKIDIGDW